MFKNIQISKFRGISNIKIEDFKQFNLFVGKNSCCKTTALESLFILVNPTLAELPSKTNIFRGIDAISEVTLELFFHNFELESPIEFLANMQVIDKMRSLKIKPRIDVDTYTDYSNNSYDEKLIDESFFQSGTIPNINGLVFESSLVNLNNVEKTYISEIFLERTEKGKIVQRVQPKDYVEKFKGIFVSPEFFAQSQTIKQFANVVVKKRKDRILQVLKHIEPLLSDLLIGLENILFCDIGQPKMLPINVMGGGINKILTVVLAIENTQDGVVFIDELENGLSPSAQETLWRAIFASAKEFNVQIFTATHSLECVRAMDFASTDTFSNNEDNIRVYRIEREKEDFNVVKFNKQNIELVTEKHWDIR